MNLAQDRFYQSELTKVFKFQDKEYFTAYTRYSYESESRLYDIDVRKSDGDKTYHINMGFDTEPTPIHKAIESHYSL